MEACEIRVLGLAATGVAGTEGASKEMAGETGKGSRASQLGQGRFLDDDDGERNAPVVRAADMLASSDLWRLQETQKKKGKQLPQCQDGESGREVKTTIPRTITAAWVGA